MKIIIDTHEQCPYQFQGKHYAGVEIERGNLVTGDYSLHGLTDKIAIERKELSDLVQCLGCERERFEREIQRAQGLDFFSVVIESSWIELASGQYRSNLNPHSGCQSVLTFMARYGVPFFFAGSRAAAEYVCWSLLRQYLEGVTKRLKAIVKAHETAA